MTSTWICLPFSQLTTEQLYHILQLRNEVFVKEQNCPYQDCDDKDQSGHHLICYQQNKIVAYSRLLPPGIPYDTAASIGRVATALIARRKGLGKELMQRSLNAIEMLHGGITIIIGAQLYLKDFYEQFGFIKQGRIYDEDGIPHITMKREL